LLSYQSLHSSPETSIAQSFFIDLRFGRVAPRCLGRRKGMSHLLPLSPSAVAAFLIIFWGYLTLNAALYIVFYQCRCSETESWKIQTHNTRHINKRETGTIYGASPEGRKRQVTSISKLTSTVNNNTLISFALANLADVPWPWRRGVKGRAPQHALFATCNLMIASLFALLTAEGTVRGIGSQLKTGHPHVLGTREVIWWLLGESWLVVASLGWQSAWEYYWHRLMHYGPVYRRFHKHHHFYKAPAPFDDMYIAPLEVRAS